MRDHLSATGITHDELRQVIAKAVEEYMHEVKRIRREGLREAVIHTRQKEGATVPEGEDLESQIDMLEKLFDKGQHDRDRIMQLIDEMDDPPVSRPASVRSNKSKKRKRNKRRKHRPKQ